MAKEGIKKINEYVFKEARTLIVNDSQGIVPANDFEKGTLYYQNDSGATDYRFLIKSTSGWSSIPLGALIEPNSISSQFYQDLSITAEKIADNTITGDKIAEGTIFTELIANGAVDSSKIAYKGIHNSNIGDDAINTENIIDKSVTNEKLADGCITSDKLANDFAIQTNNFEVNSINGNIIMDNTLDGSKIINNSISTLQLKDRSVTSIKIALNTILNENIADNTITGSKLYNYTIGADKLGTNSVTTNKILDTSVTTSKLANLAVTNAKIANSTIAMNKLASSVQADITNAIKMTSNGTAYCYGNFHATNNISAVGTITAKKVYNAVYNDLAEAYIPGEKLEPGDIVQLKEDGKVYKADKDAKCIVGVLSDEYATCYGATEEELKSGKKVPVGMIGKVHVKIYGKVKIGEYIKLGNTIIGKALETSNEEDLHKVLCLIYPN